MTRPTCKTCRYWEIWEGTKVGYCLARSPTLRPGSATGHWPTANQKHWCGEHEPIKAEAEFAQIQAQIDSAIEDVASWPLWKANPSIILAARKLVAMKDD